MTETTFDKLEIGDRFTWHGAEYVKTEYEELPRYGHTNAQGPAFYDGDTGHRHLTDDQVVEVSDAAADYEPPLVLASSADVESQERDWCCGMV